MFRLLRINARALAMTCVEFIICCLLAYLTGLFGGKLIAIASVESLFGSAWHVGGISIIYRFFFLEGFLIAATASFFLSFNWDSLSNDQKNLNDVANYVNYLPLKG